VSMKLLSGKLIRNCGQHSSVIRPFLCQENFNLANFFKTYQSPTVILQKTYQSFCMFAPDGRKLAHWIRGNLLYPFKATRVPRTHSLIFLKVKLARGPRQATRASRNYGKPSKIQNEKVQVAKINFLFFCPWWAKLSPFD
jgi:hypothetical protein